MVRRAGGKKTTKVRLTIDLIVEYDRDVDSLPVLRPSLIEEGIVVAFGRMNQENTSAAQAQSIGRVQYNWRLDYRRGSSNG